MNREQNKIEQTITTREKEMKNIGEETDNVERRKLIRVLKNKGSTQLKKDVKGI